MALAPSPRQTAILQALALPRNLLVQACAGSGKTTTLGLVCEQIPQTLRAIALCFNKSIADEFQNRLPYHVRACTLHSLGFSACRAAVRGVRVDDRKLRNVLDAMPALQTMAEAERRVVRSDLDAMVGLVTDMHLDPTDAEALRSAIDQTRRTVEAFPDSFPLLADVVNAMDSWTDVLSFGEMLRHPLIHGYSLGQFDAVLVDEAQDLNAVQHALLARIVAPGGKLIAVGDRSQSIYGFRGADPESMDRLKREWDMIELPLDVSYRCPRAVVKIAQGIIGQAIQPSDNAPEGIVEKRGVKEMSKTEAQLSAGDMVLCRINAPLVPLAFRLIRRGARVLIRGRDLGVGLSSLVRKLKAGSTEELIEKARAWADKTVRALHAADKSPSVIQATEDKVETLICFAEECTTVAQVLDKVESMFADQTPGGVVLLSTVHKAKGLEADTVVLLRPDLLPAPWAKTPQEEQQEKNIHYVAVTRAKRCLIIQESPKDKPRRKTKTPASESVEETFQEAKDTRLRDLRGDMPH